MTDANAWNEPAETAGFDAADPAPEPVAAEKPKRVAKPRKPRAPRATARRTGGATKAQIAEIAQKALDVANLESEERSLLEEIAGETGTVELVQALMGGTAKTEGAQTVLDLSETDDEGERSIAAALLGDDMKPVWQVLAALGLVAKAIPESQAKAALAISRAASELSERPDDVSRLETIVTLAG